MGGANPNLQQAGMGKLINKLGKVTKKVMSQSAKQAEKKPKSGIKMFEIGSDDDVPFTKEMMEKMMDADAVPEGAMHLNAPDMGLTDEVVDAYGPLLDEYDIFLDDMDNAYFKPKQSLDKFPGKYYARGDINNIDDVRSHLRGLQDYADELEAQGNDLTALEDIRREIEAIELWAGPKFKKQSMKKMIGDDYIEPGAVNNYGFDTQGNIQDLNTIHPSKRTQAGIPSDSVEELFMDMQAEDMLDNVREMDAEDLLSAFGEAYGLKPEDIPLLMAKINKAVSGR